MLASDSPLRPGRKPVVAGVIAIISLVGALAVYQLVDTVPMPQTVPRNSVTIPLPGKSRGWVTCSIQRTTTRCQIFNQPGEKITDDVFLPFDGGSPITANELNVDPYRTGATYVRLKNGRLLLPQTNFEEHKKFAERALIEP